MWLVKISYTAETQAIRPSAGYSSEVSRLRWLKKSVAVYRLAFGQPRQDDLMEYLRTLQGHLSIEDLEALQIRLAPPSTVDQPEV